MRVLFLTNHLRGDDGWSRYGLDLARAFQAAGHDVLCLTHEPSSGHGIPERAVLGNAISYLVNPVIAFVTARQVRKHIKEFSPDVIHCVVEPYASLFLFLKKNDSKMVLTLHGTFAFIPNVFGGIKKRLTLWMWRRIFSRIDGMIAVSDFTRRYVLESARRAMPGVAIERKLHVVTNGIDMRRFGNPDGARMRRDTKNILCVGALKPRKGVMEVVDAILWYRDHYSGNFQFSVIGEYDPDDPYARSVFEKIKQCGLNGQVTFLGKVADAALQTRYAESDVLVVLSPMDGKHFEGFGLAYIEANAHGTPAIGSRRSGAEDAIRDGFSGYLVDPRNPEEVAQRIHCIVDKGLIKPEDCMAWAQQHDIQKKAEEILELYRKR